MRVHWTDTAQSHLDAIYRYIAQDSVEYALRMVDRLTKHSERIARFPNAGSVVPEYERKDLREVVEGNYRIIYRIKAHQVDIIAVIHGARDLPGVADKEGWD